VCCVSNDIAKSIAKWKIAPADKVAIVHNGIRTSRFRPSADERGKVRQSLGVPAGAMVIGSVGRLVEVKRQEVLIEAFARLQTGSTVQPHLVLVGDGPKEQVLRELAARLNISDRVHFAGRQQEPRRFLWDMDVFALTSRSEGMPLAVLEAWAAGVPVVASRVGGLPELVDDGMTGLFFESGNIGQLVMSLEKLMNDVELRTRLGDNAFRKVMNAFDVRSMGDAYASHYVDLLARHETSPCGDAIMSGLPHGVPEH
jgi:glycosyltransferase involved in cell wall biosynthesis